MDSEHIGGWQKLAAWYNVPPLRGETYKVDADGRLIRWEEYGKDTDYGWRVDHVGGPNVNANWRARHWRREPLATSTWSAQPPAAGERFI